MPSTVTSSSAAFGRCAFGIGQPRRDRRGRTDIVKGRSVRSGGNVLTTLSCSASGIFVICCDLTRPTITRLARTFQSTRTRRRREQYIPLLGQITQIACGVCAIIPQNHAILSVYEGSLQPYL